MRLKPRSQRHRSAEEVIAGLRPKLAEAVPGMELEFVQLLQDMIGDLEGAAEPLEVEDLRGRLRDARRPRRASREHDGGGPGGGGRGGAAAGRSRDHLAGSTRRPPAAPGSPSSRSRPSSPPPGSARRRPTCNWATAASPCGCAIRTATASIPRAWRASPCGRRTAGWCRCRPWPGRWWPRADGELTRENLRQVALVTAPAGRARPGQRGRRDPGPPAPPQAAGRLLAWRWAASTSRSARLSASCSWSSAPPPRWCCSCWWSNSAPSLPRADPAARGAALLRRRLPAAAPRRLGARRLLRDGADPAGRPGGQERHRDARLRPPPARRGHARSPRRSPPPRGCACGRS